MTTETVKVKAYVAVDTSCYAAIFLDVDANLLQDEEKLTAYLTQVLRAMHDDEQIDFDPEWDTQANFRLVTAAREPDDMDNTAERVELITDMPIERNYHDFGLEISARLHNPELIPPNAPDWVYDLARHYKLID